MRYQADETKRELAKTFSPLAITRIVLAVTAVFLLTAYLLPQLIPELVFDWFAVFLKCMGALVVILAMCCTMAFVPPMITVTSKGIAISQGQTGRFYPYAKLMEIRIDDTASPYPMFLFRTLSKRKSIQYPISPKINLDDLNCDSDTGEGTDRRGA